ncbi:hypothetical protein AB8613_09675 [Vibrio sp. BS-M-Sm-2]|uniref:hypothetical protein n=1 Tax=Vibrio sp. BS-M-Sm-2 TaxID=3241167 RepID=UPI0035571CE0
MTKKSDQNGVKPQRSGGGNGKRVIIGEAFDTALNRQMPQGGRKDVETIMQRSATPPNPDSGEQNKK